MAFDLLISRDRQQPARPELATVLVDQMGAAPGALATLLEEGRVLLRIGVDFAYASWCARALAAVGAVVELVPAGAEVSRSYRVRDAAVAPAPPTTRTPAAVPAARARAPEPPPGMPLTVESGDLGPFARAVAPDAFAVPGFPDLPTAGGAAAPAFVPAPAAPPAQPPPAAAAPRDPFAPVQAAESALALDLPAAVAAPPPAAPPPGQAPRSFDVIARPPSSGNYTAAARGNRTPGRVRTITKPVVRTCERCGSLVSGEGECPRCAAGEAPPLDPGPRGLRETLHARAPLRYGLGFALALGVGYLVQAPYAGRAEARVAEVRKEADLLRYRFDAQVQARVSALDERARAESANAALWAGVLWLGAAVVVLAGWLWLV